MERRGAGGPLHGVSHIPTRPSGRMCELALAEAFVDWAALRRGWAI